MTTKRFYTDVQRHKNKLLVRGYDTGVRFQEEVHYKPYLFVEGGAYEAADDYQTVLGQSVTRVDFKSMWEANDFYKMRRNAGINVYGLTNFVYPYINDAFPGQLEVGMERIRIGTLDIEVGSEKGFPNQNDATEPVTAITVHFKDTFITLACGEFETDRKDIAYIQCDSEYLLLRKFVRIWEEMDLDVVTGWNIEFFDIPYLVNRIRKVLGQTWADRLSPWGIVKEREVEMGKSQKTYDLYGIGVLDYLRVYKKFSYIPQESYRLDNVANVDLGTGKIDYSEYASLHTLYRENHQKFIEYNIRDVELVLGLEKKHALLALCILLTFDSKINFGDVFTPMRVWDVIIHNYLIDRNQVVDPSPWERAESDEQYEGAYVKDPQVGMHEVVVSDDVTSLYPSLIVQHNISPETYAGQLDDHGFSISREQLYKHLMARREMPGDLLHYVEEKNLTLCANGSLWKKDRRGTFPELVKKIMDGRKVYKKQMLEAKARFEKTKDIKDEYEAQRFKVLQHVRKIQINSLYGCLGTKYFRWYRLEAAEAITITGQFAIQWMEADVNKLLRSHTGTQEDFVIAMDTDSIYLRLASLFEKKSTFVEMIPEVEAFCDTHIEPMFDSSALELMNMLMGMEQAVFMKRECIADKAIWTGKKHYVLNVFVDEGVVYKEPKLKLVGIEAIRTSTPAICRDMIKESLNLIMRGTQDELLEKVREYRKRYFEARFEEMALNSTANNLARYYDPISVYKSKTPVHVKGALFYNRAIASMRLDQKYPFIKEGEKIKYAYLKEPNILETKVVSVPGAMPEEFRLETYIDREKMFEVTYLNPMSKLAHAAGWVLEKITTLDELFVWGEGPVEFPVYASYEDEGEEIGEEA